MTDPDATEAGTESALVERLDRALAAARPDYHARLRPGAKDADLDAFEARFALTLPTAFRNLYRWRDGQDPRSSAALHDNRMFCSLADVAETKEMLDGMIDTDFDDPRYWRRGWVPFLHNGGGSYLCLDLAAEDGGHPGQLVGFWKQDEDRPVEYENLAAWLAEAVAALEANGHA